jgi:hypothetical protein
VAEIIKFRKNSGITRYINIIACENKLEASTFLKSKVEKYLDESEKEYMETYAGTIPYKVFKQMVEHPLTEKGLKIFADATAGMKK